MPAEWEKHDAVWVGWELFAPFNQPALNVIKELLPYVPVRVVTESRFSTQVAKEYLQLQGVDSSKPSFFVMKDNRIWLRDHGPTFLVNKKKELGFVDLSWSHYGIRDWMKWLSPNTPDFEKSYRQVAKSTGSIDSLIGLTQSARRFGTEVSLEGGSIEVNGKGVLILCETVTLQRNPG
jgi:agmatine deiminase